jgi:hypothetical protein
MADGGSCRQQACGRETVCQRDRSILKSPVTLARSGHLHLPRSLDRQVPRSLFVCLAPSGTQGPLGPPRGTENARLNPDSQPAKAGWFPQGSPSLVRGLSRSQRRGLERPSRILPRRRFQFVSHDFQPTSRCKPAAAAPIAAQALGKPSAVGTDAGSKAPHGSIYGRFFRHLRECSRFRLRHA